MALDNLMVCDSQTMEPSINYHSERSEESLPYETITYTYQHRSFIGIQDDRLFVLIRAFLCLRGKNTAMVCETQAMETDYECFPSLRGKKLTSQFHFSKTL